MQSRYQPSRRRVLTAAAGGLAGAWIGRPRLAAQPVGPLPEGWDRLFDGQTLVGWHANPEPIGHGTGALWTVEPAGVLAGEQNPPGSGNGGILLTDGKFRDFELSLDLWPSWGVDSGVFLRSTDRGQAIQMTVDYYDGGNIGHFYGEQTGGWVARSFSIEGDLEAGRLVGLRTVNHRSADESGLAHSCTPEEWIEAWRVNDWNTAVIRVEGGAHPTVTTTINDLLVGRFDAARSAARGFDRDAVAATLGDTGSIAVQVHGGARFPAGSKCRWRNIRVRSL